MTNILLISAGHGSRHWEHELVRRLLAAGHVLAIRHAAVPAPCKTYLDSILALEARRFGRGLATPSAPLTVHGDEAVQPDIAIDLTGMSPSAEVSTLRLDFNDQPSFDEGAVAMVGGLAQPELHIRQDGVAVGRARPMIGDRVWLTRYSDDILSGAIALIEQTLARLQVGSLEPLEGAPEAVMRRPRGFFRHYLPFVARGVGRRLVHKVWGWRKPIYWQVAYRLIEGPGIAETGALDGPAFTVLKDDGERFYADPFPFEHDGRHFLFVEEFPFATQKGVISVTELDEHGVCGPVRVVIEEKHHLSYPQILRSDGEIYLLPESSAGDELVLYRAVQFPDVWVRDTVLLAGCKINDATVVAQDGTFWMVGTDFNGHGSASDKMVVYSAPSLRGPWNAHALNPIAIDHSATRPGGAFIRQGDAMLLPVQNGSATYGGGLGLMRVERLDAGGVAFSPPRAVRPGPAWARAGIHTLNRVGRLETVDSAG